MSVEAYVPVLIQIILGVVIASAIIVASHIFGQRSRGNYIKDAAYECGLVSTGKFHPRFGVKFYVVAMLFILFDVEVVFLIPWVLVYREFIVAQIPILLPVLFFLFILAVGFLYEMKKGGLKWER
ncbi:NADH-quinone oxidoreductase subunit A [Ruficoccus amylovorans]|uniref:NADH-quinone oxidoreductase subunit A n=1 Tax=Ruficoccus amylovorans TaxID=1804625 RepID=A0A842HIH5_9BACT|nr:NADH-quinone oxidoreductase subunit A [Ruficoccus amylovorans]MBC2596212.1 NADH-quinone oxidoreductase subunit A [Ruficoccus amylovorans]